MYIQIRSTRNQFFCQSRFAEQMAFYPGASPNYNFGNAGKPCKFCNLKGDIFTVNRLNFCAKLFGKTHIRAQAFHIFLTHYRKIRSFHKQRCESSFESSSHSCSGTNDFRIRGRRRKTDKNMLVCMIITVTFQPSVLRQDIYPICTSAQCNFPKCRQIFYGKKILYGSFGLCFLIDISGVKSVN